MPNGRLHSETATDLDRRSVFVVHGRNIALRRAIFDFLRAIDLRPLEWEELIRRTGHAAPYVGDVLDLGFATAAAALIIMSPDEIAELRPELVAQTQSNERGFQPRPNVLLEAGMALALHRDRTVIVEVAGLRSISDILGRHTVRISADDPKRPEIANRLRSSGCAVNTDGRDWESAGGMESALRSPETLFPSTPHHSTVSIDELSDEEANILVLALNNEENVYLVEQPNAPRVVETGAFAFVARDDAHFARRHRAALDRLVEKHLLCQPTWVNGYSLYTMTSAGRDAANLLMEAGRIVDCSRLQRASSPWRDNTI